MPVNGSARDTIAINDRGFAYGDGLFETIRIHKGRPVLFSEHMERLFKGADSLKIALDNSVLEQEVSALAAEFPQEGVLKIVVTRGAGGRGYRPDAGSESTRVLSLHPLPEFSDAFSTEGICAFVCTQRLAQQPALAGLKHLNRLEQVLASLEWPEGDEYQEGIMLDTSSHVVEGTRSNLFWGESGQLFTPDLSACGVEGIMRNYLLDNIAGCDIVSGCTLQRLLAADEIFVCNSVFGIWPVVSILSDGARVSIGSSGTEKRHAAQASGLFHKLLAAHGN